MNLRCRWFPYLLFCNLGRFVIVTYIHLFDILRPAGRECALQDMDRDAANRSGLHTRPVPVRGSMWRCMAGMHSL